MHQTLPTTPSDHTVPGDGVRLHARVWGAATAAPAVVLLHGLASNARIWDGVASGLLEAPQPGPLVVALDLRGHGESEQPGGGYDFPTVARDLEIALESLGIERPVLVGHSWGANVALHVAAAATGAAVPAGLALVDGALQGISEWPGMSRQTVRRRLAPPRFAVPLEDWLCQAGRWLPAGVDPTRRWVRDFLRAGVEVDGDGVARARFRFDNHMQVVDALYEQRPPELYPRVTCPVLLCPAGGQMVDGKREAVERATRLLPDARVTWFEDAMHDIPLQRPLALAAALARLVTEVGGRG
ncbi:MAG TPA: alpha/beta hydrolase [Actinomycetes bacterium]|jgi:pimeloyl-ACP methyl ester carboxylesterase|nr:alpha/beta hydrolase [Actinomycetes bacterium]